MLGTLTMPNLLSPASPALFWAWLRYYLAPVEGIDELRITMDFADLDPHQKGILSDDFGVAISTQWLFDRFGGFTDIVDGRRFILQFAHLLRRRQKSTAKVGPSKAPDFVLRDSTGRWHVLECKGTQSGRGTRNTLLKNALSQKQVLQIIGAIRGERLAAGLSIANEQTRGGTHLRIVDPDVPEPLITLGDDQTNFIQRKAHRIAVARALGLIGLGEMAVELSLPPEVGSAEEFLRPSEISRIRASRPDRYGRATRQLRDRRLVSMEDGHRHYEGRRVQFELPVTGRDLPFNEIIVRQGVNRELLRELADAPAEFDDDLDTRLQSYTADANITLVSDGRRASLNYGEVLFSELILNRV
jgi:hypothetical protein